MSGQTCTEHFACEGPPSHGVALDPTPQTPTPRREPPENQWLQRLVKAEQENRCGDLACQTRRVSAAVRVLTGWKEHQDYCWAVETFEVEIGVRDPATVGREPDNIPSRAKVESEAVTQALSELEEAVKAHGTTESRGPNFQWIEGHEEMRAAVIDLIRKQGSPEEER
jgi:hypothetical protein